MKRKRNTAKARHRFAFTLIELLIVVAIISILSLIATVNLKLAKDRAEVARCSSNLKTIAYALFAYRIDYDHYPLADGIAGNKPSPGKTQVGKGPAANGSWDGVPLILVKLGYIGSPEVLYCPTLRRRYSHRQKYLRYAYNCAASDTWGYSGGSDNIDCTSSHLWFARCLWVPTEASFHPTQELNYPHGEEHDQENVLFNNGRVHLRQGRNDYYYTYNGNHE